MPVLVNAAKALCPGLAEFLSRACSSQPRPYADFKVPVPYNCIKYMLPACLISVVWMVLGYLLFSLAILA